MPVTGAMVFMLLKSNLILLPTKLKLLKIIIKEFYGRVNSINLEKLLLKNISLKSIIFKKLLTKLSLHKLAQIETKSFLHS